MHILPIQLVYLLWLLKRSLCGSLGLLYTGLNYQAKINIFLAGNLLNRTLGLLKKNCQSTLVVDSISAAEGNPFQDTVDKLVRFM